MAHVLVSPFPEGTPTPSLQPAPPRDYQDIPTNIREFGGAIAAGEQALGAGAQKAGAFYGQVAADDATNKYMTATRNLLYGDPSQVGPDGHPDRGYFGLEGRAAMDAAPAVVGKLEQLRQQMGAQMLTPQQSLDFDQYTRRFQFFMGEQISRHSEQQSERWYDVVEKNSIDINRTALNDAIAHGDTEGAKHAEADLVGSYTRKASRISGNDPTALKAAEIDGRRDVANTRISSYLSRNDLMGAAAELKKSEGLLSPEQALRYRSALSEANVATAVDRATGTPAGAGPAGGQGTFSGGTDEALGLIRHYESHGDYNAGYSGGDISRYPKDATGFPQWPGEQGPQGITHAAGAYQFEPETWRRYAVPLGIKDFSATSQDKVAEAAFKAEGFGPWAPYNPRLAQAIGAGGAGARQIPTGTQPAQAPPLSAGQQALAAGRPDYAAALANLQNDPSLNPIERKRAEEMLHSQFNFDFQLEERKTREAEKNLRETQTATEADLFGRAVTGEQFTPDQLAKLVQSRQLSIPGYNAIATEMTGRREAKVVDSQPATLRLWQRIGEGEDPIEDIFSGVTGRQLSGETADAMMKSLNARGKEKANQVERTAFSTLRTIAGMDAQERPMVDLDRQGNQNQVALWAQAQTEWNSRVVAGKEDPMAVLADMAPRYGHPVENIGALPHPRMGVVQKLEDVPIVKQRTQEAVDTGQITQEQFRQEQDLLGKYWQYLDAQQKREAAAKAAQAGQKGGARAVGVVPSGNQ